MTEKWVKPSDSLPEAGVAELCFVSCLIGSVRRLAASVQRQAEGNVTEVQVLPVKCPVPDLMVYRGMRSTIVAILFTIWSWEKRNRLLWVVRKTSWFYKVNCVKDEEEAQTQFVFLPTRSLSRDQDISQVIGKGNDINFVISDALKKTKTANMILL
ncbi:hypothetical protein MJT46_011132 [Ovis ammon polii x Ovis aries]|nr:hypothetical protein MJT46_011132 [Ovis ammon polii x Ovis aries]